MIIPVLSHDASLIAATCMNVAPITSTIVTDASALKLGVLMDTNATFNIRLASSIYKTASWDRSGCDRVVMTTLFDEESLLHQNLEKVKNNYRV